jgi:hypothetical protein
MAALIPARVADGMKTIDNPGGGQIRYGPLAPQRSVEAAMGETLRQVHTQYGDRPVVGRWFQDRTGESLATFFSVMPGSGAGQRLAGLVMVSVPRGGQPIAAILSDEASHFPRTLGPMLDRLSTELNSIPGSARASGGETAPKEAVRLNRVKFPDNSGSVDLPPGWSLVSGRWGVMEAVGPNSEKLLFGLYIPVIDPTNPRSQGFMNAGTRGGRQPLPGVYVAIPYGEDAGRAYISAMAQLAQKQGRPAPTINLTSVKREPPKWGAAAFFLQGDMDAHDDRGTTALMAKLFIVLPYDSSGSWALLVYQASVPKPLLEQESPTIISIAQSYRINEWVVKNDVQEEIARDNDFAKSVLERDRANADIHDKYVQAFGNIILDQTMVRDTERNAHGTISNDYADVLVRSNPGRFQYVPTQSYLKGIDY